MLRFGICKNTGRSFSIYCIMLYSIEECTASTSVSCRVRTDLAMKIDSEVCHRLWLSLSLPPSRYFFPFFSSSVPRSFTLRLHWNYSCVPAVVLWHLIHVTCVTVLTSLPFVNRQ